MIERQDILADMLVDPRRAGAALRHASTSSARRSSNGGYHMQLHEGRREVEDARPTRRVLPNLERPTC